MNKTEAIIVLKNLLTDFSVCRTEREALEVAIDNLEKDIEEIKAEEVR